MVVLWILLILPMLLDGFFLDKIDLISLGRIGPISNCLSPIGKLGNQLTASRTKGTGVEYRFLYQLKVTFLPLEIFYTALFDKTHFSDLALVVGGKLQPCY